MVGHRVLLSRSLGVAHQADISCSHTDLEPTDPTWGLPGSGYRPLIGSTNTNLVTDAGIRHGVQQIETLRRLPCDHPATRLRVQFGTGTQPD